MIKGKCVRCGREGEIHRHHIIPKKWCPVYVENKLVELCPSCHRFEHVKLGTLFCLFDRYRCEILEAPPENFFNLKNEEIYECRERFRIIQEGADEEKLKEVKKMLHIRGEK
jgi:hypothetical protein